LYENKLLCLKGASLPIFELKKKSIVKLLLISLINLNRLHI